MLRILVWAVLILLGLVGVLILSTAVIQVRRDHQNRHRIACYKDWETRLEDHLFRPGQSKSSFGNIPWKDRWLFRDFLSRYQPTLAGAEFEVIRQLYLGLGIHASLPRRLRSPHPKTRAKAALEIATFQLEAYLDGVVPLTEDAVPFVAYTAAKALGSSRDLRYAKPVMAWVLREDRYQRDRLLQVVEAFGPALLPWLEQHLKPPSEQPEAWIIYARLAESHRNQGSQARLLDLLDAPLLDLQAAAIKALTALGDPSVYDRVHVLARHESWVLRAVVALGLGILGGTEAIPILLGLMADPVFEVRRNAGQSLAGLGGAGQEALAWMAEDPNTDPFARDMARERLEWVHERGHQ